jgi:tRNA1Val (adenine37-N6)-methyltransferase
MQKTEFKGWVIPGPRPPGGVECEEGETLNAISGHFMLFQYEAGHRFSTDDLITAWYGTQQCPSAGRILDLGSGIGSVATIAAWRCPGARLVTVEAQDISVRLARKSHRYNGLEDRLDARLGDFRDPGILAPQEIFDLVLGSPPYFPLGTGLLGDHPQKIACRFEVRGSVADYARTASLHLAPGGVFACIFPEEQRERAEQGARQAGLLGLRSRPVVFREGEPPLLRLFAFARATDLPEALRERALWEDPPLTIRTSTGAVHPEYSAIKLSIGFPP